MVCIEIKNFMFIQCETEKNSIFKNTNYFNPIYLIRNDMLYSSPKIDDCHDYFKAFFIQVYNINGLRPSSFM